MCETEIKMKTMITAEEKSKYTANSAEKPKIIAASTFIVNVAAPQTDQNHNLIDGQSLVGRFGWITLETQYHIPYIYRQNEKYCSVRMLETKLLDHYLTRISYDIYYTCTNIISYYMTESERKLLNEINSFHCDYQFGKMAFCQWDLIVRLDDAIEFYHFLVVCYKKLFNSNVVCDSCGFIIIDDASVVPYVMYNKEKCLPLFYFEGAEHLQAQAKILKGWHLSYLRFCYKIQGIRSEYLNQETCTTITLDDVKQFFPQTTTFKDFWPTSVATLRQYPVSKCKTKIWHRQPDLQATSVRFVQTPTTASTN